MANRVEKHRIYNKEHLKIIDELSFMSKNIYNLGNYIIRQEYFSTCAEVEQGIRDNANWLRYTEVDKICKKQCDDDSCKILGSSCVQQTLRILDSVWKSYFAAKKEYNKNQSKFTGKPKPPMYLEKNGRFQVRVTNQNCKLIDGYIYFSLKALRPLNGFYKTHIPDGMKLLHIRFVPCNGSYTMEVVYEKEVPEISGDFVSARIAAIDLGINNVMTVTNNIGLEPFVINGKPLKSMNQYYNKEFAKLQSDLKIRHDQNWSKKLQRIATKRNNKVNTYIHQATTCVVNWCIDNNIDTLVCGHNEGWKQEVNMGKENNQKFTEIPHTKMIDKLSYKCENVGIKFIKVEESYTSGTSFLDREDPIKKNYNKSRRKYRGLFVTNDGTLINADVNGAYQIMKKAFPDAFMNGIDDVKIHPYVLNVA